MKLNQIPKLILISTIIIIALVALWHFESEWHLSHGSSVPPRESPQGQIPKRITGKDGTPMVLIPAGEFQMGSNVGEDDEKPVRPVYIDAFYMDSYEVTNAQFQKFCELTGRPPHGHRTDGRPGYGKPNQPAMGMAWQEAVEYCEWAGKRLPTEAEWEKAARGGLEGKRYPWGDEPPDETKTNFDRHVGHPTPVGSYPPNGYDVYDMAGNVEEWCYDWYRPDYYQNSPKRNPKGPDSGFHSRRVVRGADWMDTAKGLRCARRLGENPKPRGNLYNYGFRCAKSVSQ